MHKTGPVTVLWTFNKPLLLPDPFNTDDWDVLSVHDGTFGWQAAAAMDFWSGNQISLSYEFDAAYDLWRIWQQPHILFDGPTTVRYPVDGALV